LQHAKECKTVTMKHGAVLCPLLCEELPKNNASLSLES
jgi:hypothetical protein